MLFRMMSNSLQCFGAAPPLQACTSEPPDLKSGLDLSLASDRPGGALSLLNLWNSAPGCWWRSRGGAAL